MDFIKDDFGVWFELNKICDLLSLTVLEVMCSSIKDSFPSQYLQLKDDIMYINSFGVLILASYARNSVSIVDIQNILLDAMRFWLMDSD